MSLLVYEHLAPPASRRHLHMIVRGWIKSVKTLRNYLKELDYVIDAPSIKIFTGNQSRAITYMSKGIYEPYYPGRYNAMYIHVCKTAWVGEKPEIRETPLMALYKEWTQNPLPVVRLPDNHLDDSFSYAEWSKTLVHQIWKSAISFAIHRENGMCTHKARNIAKQLSDTYCFANKLNILR